MGLQTGGFDSVIVDSIILDGAVQEDYIYGINGMHFRGNILGLETTKVIKRGSQSRVSNDEDKPVQKRRDITLFMYKGEPMKKSPLFKVGEELKVDLATLAHLKKMDVFQQDDVTYLISPSSIIQIDDTTSLGGRSMVSLTNEETLSKLGVHYNEKHSRYEMN